MTSVPVHSAPPPGQAVPAAPAGQPRDRRGSPLPTGAMISATLMELRRRRGLMVALVLMAIGLPGLFEGIRLLLHAFAPRTNPPAGGDMIFAVLVAGFLPTFAFIAAATAGCTAGSRDLTEGVFRHLVITGRSRLALYLARIPAGLAIVGTVVAIGYALVCAVSIFAAPSFVDDSNANVPPGLSEAGFEHWAATRARTVICDLPYSGRVPPDVACPAGPISSLTPAQTAPPALDALAVRIARQDYSGYRGIFLRPPATLMLTAGIWIELEAAVGFVLGLGLASLLGQRTGPVILLIMSQLILDPILIAAKIPALEPVRRWFFGLALARLEPAALPMARGLPGVSGGIGGPGSGQSLLPESPALAACVIAAWLTAWTIIGAWRMMTRDA
jgi:hypothetical protein